MLNNVLIIDDQQIVRMGLCALVKDEIPSAAICEAKNPSEALQKVKEIPFNLILMDLKIQGSTLLSLIEQIRVYNPKAKILVITCNAERVYALRCLQIGVYGYIQKTAKTTEIQTAIGKVFAGKKHMSQAVVELLTDFVNLKTKVNPFGNLSKRELEVADMLVKGKAPHEICEIMSLQPSTISTYKTRILKKLNVQNVIELSKLEEMFEEV